MGSQNEQLQEFLSQWFAGEGIRAYTSGSTGEPKAILLPMSQVERSARRTVRFFHITKESRLHCAISFRFIGGKMMIARSLVSNCLLTFSEPSLAPAPPEAGRQVDLMSVVPAQMPYILANLKDFSNVRSFLLGGSHIDDRLWDKIVASGIDAWESYGMTELASHIALRRVAGCHDARPRFVPFAKVKVSVDSENCLKIKDGDIRLTTNDIAELAPDGRSFRILGRRDDVIVTGGLKVLPQTIEKILLPRLFHLLGEFFISSAPDELWTSRLILIGVPLCETKSYMDEEKLKASIAASIDAISEEVLPRKFRPKEIRIVDALPTTDSGKLIRTSKFS